MIAGGFWKLTEHNTSEAYHSGHWFTARGWGHHGPRRLVALPAVSQEAPTKPEDMKPYVETLPSTEITFEMVPIPGGTFTIGSPEDEEDRDDDEGPQREVKIAPFWMGKHEVTWDEYDEFAFSFDLKAKKRAGIDLATQAEGEKTADAISRPTPPYADETFGLGREGQPVICITHHAAMEYCRWLSAKTGKTYRLPTEAEWEYAARAGTTGPFSVRRERTSTTTPGTSRMPRSRWRSARRSPTPSACTTSTATWPSGASITTSRMPTPRFRRAKPAVGPVVLPDAKEYPYVVRGGSWDDDPEMLRSAARRASNHRLERSGPAAPAVHLVAHRRHLRRLPRRAPPRRAGKPEGPEVAGRQGQHNARERVPWLDH